MDVYIETLTGGAFELRVSPFETVLSVKAKIQRFEGIPIAQQHLVWQEEELEDDFCLHDYDIQDGATLRLVLAMRGGPINTRRVTLEDPALREVTDYMESNRDELLEQLPSGRQRQVTLLVYREGDQLNFYRVVERGDGTLSPLSESLSGNSVYNLYEEEEEEEEGGAGSDERVEENVRMKEKMRLLRSKMHHLTLNKKPKRKVPHPPSSGSRPKSRSRRFSNRTKHYVGPYRGGGAASTGTPGPADPGSGGASSGPCRVPATLNHPSGAASNGSHSAAAPTVTFLPQISKGQGGGGANNMPAPPSYAKPTQGMSPARTALQGKQPHLSSSHTVHTKAPQQGVHPTTGAYPLHSKPPFQHPGALLSQTGSANVNGDHESRTLSGAENNNNDTMTCNNNYLPSKTQLKDVSRSEQQTETGVKTSNSNFAQSKVSTRPKNRPASGLNSKAQTTVHVAAAKKISGPAATAESEISLSPEANSVSPGAMSHTPLISAPGLSPRSSVLQRRPKSSSDRPQKDLDLREHLGNQITEVLSSDVAVAKETEAATNHGSATSSRQRKDAASSVTLRDGPSSSANQNSASIHSKHALRSSTSDKMPQKTSTSSPAKDPSGHRSGSGRPPTSARNKQNGGAPTSGGIVLESLTSQEARGLLHQTSLERLGSSRIGNYYARARGSPAGSASRSRTGFVINGDRIYSPDGTRISARLRRSAVGSPRLPPVKHKKKKRCYVCAKKTGIATSYSCRCGNNYCATHRYAEAHGCTFDYKSEGRKILEQSNPVVTAPKLPKI